MSLLPAGFDGIERFVPNWAVADDMERLRRREAGPEEELREFYEAMAAEIDRVMDHLQQYNIKDMDEKTIKLYQLALSFMDVGFLLERVVRTDRSLVYPLSRVEFSPLSIF